LILGIHLSHLNTCGGSDAYLKHKEEGRGPVDLFPHVHTMALMAHRYTILYGYGRSAIIMRFKHYVVRFRDLRLFAQDQYIFLAGEEGTGA
jgi:hypothetical protein